MEFSCHGRSQTLIQTRAGTYINVYKPSHIVRKTMLLITTPTTWADRADLCVRWAWIPADTCGYSTGKSTNHWNTRSNSNISPGQVARRLVKHTGEITSPLKFGGFKLWLLRSYNICKLEMRFEWSHLAACDLIKHSELLRTQDARRMLKIKGGVYVTKKNRRLLELCLSV